MASHMEITIAIRPSGTLTPEQFIEITAAAARSGKKPEQFVVDAILAKLDEAQKEGQPV